MPSVTQRIKEIKQPYGGYLKPSEFEKIEFKDGIELGKENIHRSFVGLTVDYMTRYMMGTPIKEAFKVSLIGSKIIDDYKYSSKLIRKIKGLNDESIYNACKLVGYDVCFRAGPTEYKDVKKIEADDITINNIKIMVERSLKFLKNYGPVVKDGFTFEGGYTRTIDSGDGDFLTNDTLWDFKVSTSLPTSKHTLQLLIYYIMGKKSIHNEFNNIKKIGIFNPRLNCVFYKEIDKIPNNIIETVSKEVIGYDSKNKKMVSTDDLTMVDVMKELHCTRYMVMKYYSENGLPLKKINNKYYITKSNLYKWIIEMEEEIKRKERNTVISLLSGIFLGIIVLLIMVKIIF